MIRTFFAYNLNFLIALNIRVTIHTTFIENEAFGNILHVNWYCKRSLASVQIGIWTLSEPQRRTHISAAKLVTYIKNIHIQTVACHVQELTALCVCIDQTTQSEHGSCPHSLENTTTMRGNNLALTLSTQRRIYPTTFSQSSSIFPISIEANEHKKTGDKVAR